MARHILPPPAPWYLAAVCSLQHLAMLLLLMFADTVQVRYCLEGASQCAASCWTQIPPCLLNLRCLPSPPLGTE